MSTAGGPKRARVTGGHTTVGSGLLARSFGAGLEAPGRIVVFASGVSNSQCRDPREFARERELLEVTLHREREASQFVYFSTCSVLDASLATSPYVEHKRAMEELVRANPGHVIFRLPQVAGRTPNPHTLLNFLYSRIARGERFSVWQNARRNIIDCEDVRAIGHAVIRSGARSTTLNLACTHDYSPVEIVEVIERIVSGHAVYDLVEAGAAYRIDVSAIRPFIAKAGVRFDAQYLERIVRKYYGTSNRSDRLS